MKRNLTKAIVQVMYGFLLSWGVLEALSIRQPFKITLILSVVFIPGWMLFNFGYEWTRRRFQWPWKRPSTP